MEPSPTMMWTYPRDQVIGESSEPVYDKEGNHIYTKLTILIRTEDCTGTPNCTNSEVHSQDSK